MQIEKAKIIEQPAMQYNAPEENVCKLNYINFDLVKIC